MDFGEEVEYTTTLLTARECNAFQIPPPATARGHKAEDWRGKQIWKGFVTVISKIKGSKSKWIIQMVNDDKSIFAECRIDDSYDKKIDRCYDSTRFFAILIENDKGQKANIGIGFVDRNDAFDFISCLDDYTRQINREKGIEKYNVSQLEKDYSLKEGEKIEIHIKGITDKKKDTKVSSGGLKKLAPPRSGKKLEAPGKPKPKEPEPEESKDLLDDMFTNDLPSSSKENSDGLFDM